VPKSIYAGQGRRYGVDYGVDIPPHFCQGPFLRLMKIRRFFFFFFFGGGVGVGGNLRTRTAAVNVSFCSAPPFTCLLFTNDPIIDPDVCESDFYFLHAGPLTIIRKRLQGKKFTSSIHSKHYFWLTGEFQKYQTEVAYFAPRLGCPTAEFFQLQGGGGIAPDPRYRLALRARHESYSRLLSTPLFSTWRRPAAGAPPWKPQEELTAHPQTP